jgi:hypothetical protein
MGEQQPKPERFPLLEALLREKGLSLKGIYTNHDVADIFGVATRTIQEWSRNGGLMARNLPGRARFLSGDLEEFLQKSSRAAHSTDDDNGSQLRYISQNKPTTRHVAR